MKSQPVVIKDVLDGILRNLGGGSIPQAGALNAAWTKAVGESGTRHTKPIDIKDGVLIIHVDSSSWLHKLTMEKAAILAYMKNEMGEGPVKDIKLRIGPLL